MDIPDKQTKNPYRDFIRFVMIFLILVILGYLLLVAVYALPTKEISDHVQESCIVFETEGTYGHLIPSRYGTRLDNFTDALMMLNAENDKTESAWFSALNVSRLTADGYNPVETLLSLHSGEKLNYTTTSYGRYWHGYLVYLKPLLMFFNYQQIRYILIFIQMALVFIVLYMMGKKNKKECFLPFLATIFFLNPDVTSLSLQFTPVLILTVLQFITILLLEDKYKSSKKLWLYHFFVIGCLTAYFDFLTYPLVTFGVPIAFLVSQYAGNCKIGLRALFGTGFSWVAGYGLMWASKWVLGTAITGNNMLAQAKDSIELRTNYENNDTTFGILDVIEKNINVSRQSLEMVFLLFLICIIVGFIKKNIEINPCIIPLVCIFMLPFLWYAVLSNHSWVHFWMTYRELAISVYALLAIYGVCTRKHSVNLD